MKKLLYAAAVLLACISPLRAADCPYSENPLDWYYTATDTSPSTTAWASARGVTVTKASDAGYIAFAAAFGTDCVPNYTTLALLLSYLNGIAVTVHGADSYNIISSAADFTLTNPVGAIGSNDLACTTDVTMTTSGKAVTLPIMNVPNGIPLGKICRIRNNGGSNSFDIKRNDGTTLASAVAIGNWVDFFNTSFATNNGTARANPIFTGVLDESRGGTGFSSLGFAINNLLSGDITATTGGVTAIGANKVTNAKAAQMAAHTIKGNSTASTANSSDMSLAVARSEIALGNMEVCLVSADLNITTDQAFVVPFPSGFTRFRVQAITASNPSKNLSGSAAAGGIYTAASKGGTAIVANTQVFTALTNSTANTTGNLVALTVVNAATASYTPAAANTVYLSLTTPDGGAATADICLFLNPLP